MAVCDKTFKIYGSPPYRDHFELLPPHQEVPLEQAGAFACSKDAVRYPRETKGMDYDVTELAEGPYCGEGSDCC